MKISRHSSAHIRRLTLEALESRRVLSTLMVGGVNAPPNADVSVAEVHSEMVSVDDVVHFEDAALEQAIREELEIPDGDLTSDDLQGLTRLPAYDSRIASLEGIQYCTNLRTLYLDDNQISDLTPLAGLTSLQSLRIDDNQISDLTPLAGLTSLHSLSMDNNQISDLTPLAGLTSLSGLHTRNNQISDLTPLAGFTSLLSLYMGNNQISDLTPLAGLPILQALYMGNNQISDLTPLAGFTSLLSLYMGNNQISDLTPLAGLPILRTLRMGNNQISDLTPLAGVPSLRDLYMGNNQISDLTPLAVATRLQDLYMGNNQISDLTPLAGLTSLQSLYMVNNQISDLTPLAGLTSLYSLHMANNQISDLTGLAGLPRLNSLYLPNNQISDLTPLAGLPGLWGCLCLDNNQISDLTPLTGWTYLWELRLSGNQISDLTPLAGLWNLDSLNMANNQISDLTPLAGLRTLQYLYMANNQISDLTGLTGLRSLDYLYLANNQISDLTPLVDNEGIGPGHWSSDTVDVSDNPLSITAYEEQIPALQARGAEVHYDLNWRIRGRHLLYSNSVFDGDNPDTAIAPDKEALLPGQTATFANYSSYDKGINGIVVDIYDPAGTPTADDFQFKVGNDDDPAGWAIAPEPTITTRPGEGVDGSDRVTLIWAENAIQKQWLEVTVRATENTALEVADVFYFGNAIGECGNSTTDAKVNAVDMLAARDNPRGFLDPAPIDFDYDFNRDARVNATDMLIARGNSTHFLNALQLITVPAAKGAGLRDSSHAIAVVDQAASLTKPEWVHEFEAKKGVYDDGNRFRGVDSLLAAFG